MIESNKEKNDVKNEMPIGLGFGLAANEDAMKHFSNMSEKEKRQVIEASRTVNSKREMEAFIKNISDL